MQYNAHIPLMSFDEQCVHNSKFFTLYQNNFTNQRGKYLSVILPETNQNHLEVQISPRIKLRLAYQKDSIRGLTITTYENGNQKGHITLSSFTLGHITEFLEIIKLLDISQVTERKISFNLEQNDKCKNSISTLINQTLNSDDKYSLVANFLDNGFITDKDIVNTGYRKQQLNLFKNLIYDPNALTQYQKLNELSSHSEEKTWQHFFEKNEWIFGYGLDYRFNKILQREAHLNSANLDGSNSVIADYVLADNKFTTFVEIKRANTPLCKSQKLRGNCWRLSNDLYEAHSQILEQKISGQTKFETNQAGYCTQGNRIEQGAYDSKAILIIGSWHEIEKDDQYTQDLKIRTLELFRRDLRNIEIITFDELYERAKFIVEH